MEFINCILNGQKFYSLVLGICIFLVLFEFLLNLKVLAQNYIVEIVLNF